MRWTVPPFPKYFLTAWYLVKNRDNFNFTFITSSYMLLYLFRLQYIVKVIFFTLTCICKFIFLLLLLLLVTNLGQKTISALRLYPFSYTNLFL